jgi:hypothetical protein
LRSVVSITSASMYFQIFCGADLFHETLLTVVGIGGIFTLRWAGSSEQGSTPSEDVEQQINSMCMK